VGAVKLHDPFPHFFARDVFPAPFYAELMRKLTSKTDFHDEKFANRAFADSLGDFPELEFMKSKEFFAAMLQLFPDDLKHDFGGRKVSFYRDLRLIRDRQHYKIGPHTDAKWKVLSLLFYLPATHEHRDYGTVIYAPKDDAFRCAGGPHYPFEPFREVWRAPYVPNSCLGFYKTDHSFHGVPPIPIDIQRDVLLFNIYQKDAFDASHPPPPKPQMESS
jgi:hypothetical protein